MKKSSILITAIASLAILTGCQNQPAHQSDQATSSVDHKKHVKIVGDKKDSHKDPVSQSDDHSADDSASIEPDHHTTKKSDNVVWSEAKDGRLKDYMDDFSEKMDQDYIKYNGVGSLPTSTGTSYPRDFDELLMNGSHISIGWAPKGVGNYDYNVVAIYNHDGTEPPMPNHITYFFAFHNGQPIVLVDQSRDGDPVVSETQNKELKDTFAQIADTSNKD